MRLATLPLSVIPMTYPEWVNPHSVVVGQQLDAFFAHYALYERLRLPRQRLLLAHARVNDYMFPRAAPDRLFVTGLMMVYFFLVDYVYDVCTIYRVQVRKSSFTSWLTKPHE
jgi:hypothetical protein